MSDAEIGRTSGRNTGPTAGHDDEGFAPIGDLPLPGVHHEHGDARAHDGGASAAAPEARDSDRFRGAGVRPDADPGAASDRYDGAASSAGAGTSDGEYSDAPEVAQWSAADDGRDEGSTRTAAVDGRDEDGGRPAAVRADAGAEGREESDGGVARSYDRGPADQVADAAPADRSLSGLDDESIGHVFDQTNGVVEALDGDSDGLAGSDEHSAAER